MVRPFLRARATIVTALFGAFLAPATQAADFPAIEAPLIEEGPVEWGSNWYLRGDVGWQNVTVPAITGNFANSFNGNDIVSGGIGGGYQFNEWIRADITVDRSVFRRNGAVGQLWCPYAAIGMLDSGTDQPMGVLANPADTCTQYAKATLNRTTFLANGYIDLGNFWGFTPYVGGGLGLTYNQASSSLTYYRNSDGGIWAPDLSLPDGQVPEWIYANGALYPVQLPFGPTNWNTAASKKSWQFAWNLMAGVSYDISQNLKVDVGYRYLNAGTYTSLPAWGPAVAPVTKDITSHELRVGVRIVAN